MGGTTILKVGVQVCERSEKNFLPPHLWLSWGDINSRGIHLPKNHDATFPFLHRPPSPFPPSPFFPFFPFLPFSPIPLLSLRSRTPSNPVRGSGECCELPKQGLRQSPSRNQIWCIFALKHDGWWQEF